MEFTFSFSVLISKIPVEGLGETKTKSFDSVSATAPTTATQPESTTIPIMPMDGVTEFNVKAPVEVKDAIEELIVHEDEE